jgi:pimeloyl-ACP methyl ester carboxylesterase
MFIAEGNLKHWTIIDILHKIQYPTLLLSAPMDEVQSIVVSPWFNNLPKVKWVEFINSTHLAQFEEPERYSPSSSFRLTLF